MKNKIGQLIDPEANEVEVTLVLLKLLKVNVSRTTIKNEINDHPFPASLLSLSDVLNNYGVENIALNLVNNKIINIADPFIAQLNGINEDKEYFTVVRYINETNTQFFDPIKHQWLTEGTNDFLKRCTGLVLLVDPQENAGEIDYRINKREETKTQLGKFITYLIIPFALFLTWAVAIFQSKTDLLFPFLFSVFTLSGAIISGLLIWFDLDEHNPFLQKICTSGKTADCNAIVKSKGGKIAGISWSIIGFNYFLAILLLLIITGITNPVSLFIISWVNVLSLPYVFFSVYYQWKVEKKWCKLCLAIQAVLLAQFVVALLGGWHNLSISSISAATIIQGIIALSLPLIISILVIPSLRIGKEKTDISRRYNKLKRDRFIFETLLKTQQALSYNRPELGITLGNPEANFKIIKVCNPYCSPCADAHKPIEQLLHTNPDLQVQIIYSASNSDEDFSAEPVKHFLAINENNDAELTKKALDDWYLAKSKDYSVFASKYPLDTELDRQKERVEEMSEWCAVEQIEGTPTFFVSIGDDDGNTGFYKLPDIYSISDLKYLLSV